MKTLIAFLRSILLATLLLAALACANRASAQSYLVDLNSRTVTDLNRWGGSAINEAGQAAGGEERPFITGPDGMGVRDLPIPADSSANGRGINDAGQVVGRFYTAESNIYHPFITGPDGTGVRQLGTLGGAYSQANGINNGGQVAGWSDTASGHQHAFITGPNGVGMRDLGTLGGSDSYAFGINDTGQVVGWSDTASGHQHAFITGPNGVGMRDLGTLGSVGVDYSGAYGINESGQVTGYSSTAGGYAHAFFTGPDAVGMRDLGTLGPPGPFANLYSSTAYGINDAGQVVGWSDTGGYQHAFITGPDGMGMMDLNSLVNLPSGVPLAAKGINNSGQIIVAVIPEPESYALLLAGLALVAAIARRKKGMGLLPVPS